ncbi:MAG: hypothetical protein NUW22_12350 [Acidobacteria bacterium]|nr:hypothetical protein [Acidobacteriota bacterium]
MDAAAGHVDLTEPEALPKSRVARRLLDKAFCVPGFHSLGRLASCASDLGASMIDVKCALNDLVTRGAICARTVGTERQWGALQARRTTEARQ